MKLNIPQQSKPTKDAIPSHPRKLKKILAALPNTNMGELTKQTFQILRELNRQTMPNKHRLEDLEMLRVLAREIFKNLNKYFINRTLPLPDKSQKIVNLNQSILRELIYGYEIIAYESAESIDTKVDDKTLSIAICRAITYLSEMLLRSSEVYAPCPKGLWLETHQLYLYAESKNITDKIVIDKENQPEKTTIENSYKQILLFSLARPIALRQRDSERVYSELFEWVNLCSIQRDANRDKIDKLFSMRVNEDAAPDYLSEGDLAEDVTIRTMDANRLVTHINETIEQQISQKQKLVVGDNTSLEALKTLSTAWGFNAKRRFSRASRKERINVAMGLSRIVKSIQKSLEEDVSIDTTSGFIRTSASRKQDPGFTLESINSKENTGLGGYMTHTEIGAGENNSWDMVAKGRALTDTYTKQQSQIDQGDIKPLYKDIEAHWHIVNISAGGYRLRWDSNETSKAQIGELIALQEFSSNEEFKWHIGAVRWMQFTEENNLEIGVQVISPKVVTATAQRVNRPSEIPFECLMFPGIKTLNQSPSTILPSHAFKTGDKLIVQIMENKLDITLADIKEHTGSFTQFTYKNTDEAQRIKKQVKKEKANKNKDDFDELWSSL
ncbi:MAG: hypothetical protein IMF14_00265 [Proteobacteria bacterium]|nr:hypothetical protein [Pseudomonadota bacterium]